MAAAGSTFPGGRQGPYDRPQQRPAQEPGGTPGQGLTQGGGQPEQEHNPSVLCLPTGTRFAFKKVAGPLLAEAKKAYHKHQTALRDARTGLANEDKADSDLKNFLASNKAPGWCKLPGLQDCKQRSLEAPFAEVPTANSTQEVWGDAPGFQGHFGTFLAAKFPWLQQLPLPPSTTWENFTTEQLVDTLNREHTKLLLTLRANHCAQQKKTATTNARGDAFKEDLLDALNNLVKNAEDLTGLNLKERFEPERQELLAFHEESTKALLAKAAAEKKHDEEKKEAQQKKEEAEKQSYYRADFRKVLQAAVNEAVAEALPKLGVKHNQKAAKALNKDLPQADHLLAVAGEVTGLGDRQAALDAGGKGSPSPKAKPKAKPNAKAAPGKGGARKGGGRPQGKGRDGQAPGKGKGKKGKGKKGKGKTKGGKAGQNQGNGRGGKGNGRGRRV